MTSTDARGAEPSTLDIRLALPLVPPKQMSHNARGSRWDTSRVTKKHRKQVKEIVEQAVTGLDMPKGIALRYDLEVFWGKGRLRCDEDGLASMMKPILDGVSDGLSAVSDRNMHIGVFSQGRAPDGKGWMRIRLREDDRDHDCGRMNWDERDSLLSA